MADEQTVNFGPYRLDPANARLWHASQPLRLTPKAFQVLCFLAARPGQLVSKDELFQAVWTDTIISEATLTSAIQEIRKALADNAREPQYVETVPKRGFRFIGEVVSSQYPVVSREESQTGSGKSPEQNEGLRLEANGQGLESSIQSLESAEQRPIVVGRTSDLRDGPTPSPQRVWSSRNVALAGVVLLLGLIAVVQYLSQPSLSTQDWSVPAPATPG